MAATEQRPLRVLTTALATSLRDFNAAARHLQAKGVRLLQIKPTENCLQISPEDGERLVRERLTEGYQRHASAGSDRITVLFEGVTLEWRRPISYRDLQTTIH
ncbi:hypothetical protein DP090_022885 [Pseudomonas sp. MDMC216]|nr:MULTISPECIES: hypothetical protein [unclassified Pseudomonas]MBA4682081.1 hypothetical protein [Pseudomonas sp.]MDI5995866.1 hypothetical protein [Pseudomonas sp. MDMC216]MDI6008421.1 hypothetical protein [Pseudomonas sp. MDMC17]RAR40272.1 hypothetical protein DP092_02470 [Pseudomonas sp. MDMC224]